MDLDPQPGGAMSSLSEIDRSKVVDLDLGSSEFKQNARNILAEWARRPPFYVFSSGPAQVVCGRYADVHEVFSDTERFSSELPRGHGFEQFDKFMGVQFITQMDGERHARIRRLLMPAFSARSLSRLETRITEIIEGMLDKIEAGGNEFDGMQDYGAQLVVGALLTAMANLDEHQKEIFLAFHEVLPLTTYTKPGEPFAPECVRAFERAAQLVREIIAQRRANPHPDFINDLITARDQGDKLTDRELFDQIFTICGAALSATSRTAGGALYTLYSHPGQLAELIRDPSLIPEAVEECLRVASNGYFTFPRNARHRGRWDQNPRGHGGAALATSGELRSQCVSRPLTLRYSSPSEADHGLWRRTASLHRQHSWPHHDHHRDPPGARALPPRQACRSQFRSDLWRRGRGTTPATSADEDPMTSAQPSPVARR
jgi:cytochrome P450